MTEGLNKECQLKYWLKVAKPAWHLIVMPEKGPYIQIANMYPFYVKPFSTSGDTAVNDTGKKKFLS